MSKDDQPTTINDLKSLMTLPFSDFPIDPRFQNTNVTRCCYTNYVDYHRCQYLLGENDTKCDIFKAMYKRMCPDAWIESWDEKRKKGIFPRNCITEID